MLKWELSAVEAKGREISCKKGCGACCSQPVPVAEIEAYQIAELVENLPEPRRTEVKERFDKAFAHFAEIGWFEKLSEAPNKRIKNRKQLFWNIFTKEFLVLFWLMNPVRSIRTDRLRAVNIW